MDKEITSPYNIVCTPKKGDVTIFRFKFQQKKKLLESEFKKSMKFLASSLRSQRPPRVTRKVSKRENMNLARITE